jgi:hypothetical protein
LAARRKRDHLWFYDERPTMRREYRSWVPLLPMMTADFAFVECFKTRCSTNWLAT